MTLGRSGELSYEGLKCTHDGERLSVLATRHPSIEGQSVAGNIVGH